ncbi:LLM class flavin-dependent oxidoreductase [Sorangium sp. So ce295]|uniref:LLM class flavin-dependent oxidoreductase n=1 Tax=Sorangium sp. So ce295 TaxID=3133295 RepID=UPI003F5E30E5
MSSPRKQLRLGAFIPATGHHVAAWRHPDAHADGGHSFKHYKRVAQAAEEAKFDAVFLADSAAVWGGASDLASLSRSARAAAFEPITLLSALSSVTEQASSPSSGAPRPRRRRSSTPSRTWSIRPWGSRCCRG